MNTGVDLSSMDRLVMCGIIITLVISVGLSAVSCTERMGESLSKLQKECDKKGGRLIMARYEGYVCVKEFSL